MKRIVIVILCGVICFGSGFLPKVLNTLTAALRVIGNEYNSTLRFDHINRSYKSVFNTYNNGVDEVPYYRPINDYLRTVGFEINEDNKLRWMFHEFVLYSPRDNTEWIALYYDANIDGGRTFYINLDNGKILTYRGVFLDPIAPLDGVQLWWYKLEEEDTTVYAIIKERFTT